VKRFGLLGDIHAEDANLAAALDVFRRENVDQILCVGDIVDGLGDPARCIHALIEANAISVRGNHDRWFASGQMRTLPNAHASLDDKGAAFINALPATLNVQTDAGLLLLCHGVADNDMVKLVPDAEGYALDCIDELQDLLADDTYRFVVAGHTHQRMVRAFDRPRGEPLIIINCGTLKRGSSACFAIMDVNDGVQFFDFTSTGAAPAERMPFR
jgi:predicted phosphodiesterase